MRLIVEDGILYEPGHASLQGSLVARLGGAFLLEDLLQVVVDERLGAVRDGGGHLLQA